MEVGIYWLSDYTEEEWEDERGLFSSMNVHLLKNNSWDWYVGMAIVVRELIYIYFNRFAILEDIVIIGTDILVITQKQTCMTVIRDDEWNNHGQGCIRCQ